MKHQRFLDISQAPDAKALEQRLLAFANDLDFGLFTGMMVVDRPGLGAKVVAFGNTPEGFLEASKDLSDSQRDPVMHRLKELSVPFLYDQNLYVKEGAGDLWDQQASFGYKTGVAVALHLPGHKHFLLGMDRERALPKNDLQLTRLLATLQLVAVHAQDAALRVLADLEEERSLPKLSAREKEIMRWTTEGKTAWEIGTILGISHYTVMFHQRSVASKLGVVTKIQAALKAMSLGLL